MMALFEKADADVQAQKAAESTLRSKRPYRESGQPTVSMTRLAHFRPSVMSELSP
jgi:hypothetical protein